MSFGRLLVSLITITYLSGCQESVETFSCLDPTLSGKMIQIEGGEFQFGDNRFYPDESPKKPATVTNFQISNTEVTNEKFSKFVEATGYVTDAERGLSKEEYPNIPDEFRVPGSMVFIAPESNQPASPATWWQFVADHIRPIRSLAFCQVHTAYLSTPTHFPLYHINHNHFQENNPLVMTLDNYHHSSSRMEIFLAKYLLWENPTEGPLLPKNKSHYTFLLVMHIPTLFSFGLGQVKIVH